MVWPAWLSSRTKCHNPWRSSTSTPGGRLVQNDHRRLVHQRLRHQHAPLHAARQLPHVGMCLVRQIQALDDLVDPGVVVAQTEVARLDAQRLAHSEERIEHQFLRHDAERSAARAGTRATRRSPSRAELPASARASPARMLISVVLPAPLGPSSPKNSPASISRLTPSKACTAPKRLWTCLTSMAAVMAAGAGCSRRGAPTCATRCAELVRATA